MTDTGGTTSANLPSLLWECILFTLTMLLLLLVRAVYRQWRDPVTSSQTLRRRDDATSVEYSTSRDRPQMELLDGRLQLIEFKIVRSGPWWANYGPVLTELRLERCTSTVKVLYELLRKTPNLKELQINDSEVTGSEIPNFRLMNMKCFTVDNPNRLQLPQGLINKVGRVFPRLKELRLLRGVANVRFEESIRILTRTLERLELIEGQNLELLCQMDKLRLKEFSGYIDFSSSAWKLFCRKQPRLEKLLVMAKNCQVLHYIGRSVSNLKYLRLNICSSMQASFFNDMKNLERLDLYGHENALDFSSAGSPKLNYFYMVNTTATRLIQYLHKSPDLVDIKLHECTLIGDSGQPGHFPKLRVLFLSMSKLPATLTLSLCLQNPQLECLHLRFLSNLTNDQFAQICETVGPNLREFAVTECDQLTDAAGDYIIWNCRSLKIVQFHGFNLSEENATCTSSAGATRSDTGSDPGFWAVHWLLSRHCHLVH